MTIPRREDGGIVVLDAAGEYFGGRETEILDRAIADEIASGNRLMILDLSACRAMNSTALGVLIEAHRVCEGAGGVLKLCGAKGRVKTLLDVVHAEHWFEHYDRESEARASFAQRASA